MISKAKAKKPIKPVGEPVSTELLVTVAKPVLPPVTVELPKGADNGGKGERVGDRVRHIDPKFEWEGTVVANSHTSPWDCAPGTVIIKKNTGATVLLPVRLLKSI